MHSWRALLALAPALALWTIEATARERYEYDEWIAEDIMTTCATCHGEFGQGGGGGEYPRLAGLPQAYLAEQMRLFKTHERENIPMIPYANERELPAEEVFHITTYLSRLRLPTQLPPIDEATYDPLKRLNMAKRMLQIPRAEGDLDRGRALYDELCASCHGNNGWGRRDTPQLAGQYTEYLGRQIDAYRQGERDHKGAEKLFADRPATDMRDILAYISILDDEPRFVE